MDYVLSPKRMRGRLLDVNACLREGGEISDHFLVEAQLKVVGIDGGVPEGWTHVRNVLKVSELNKIVKEQAYQESLRVKYDCCEVGSGEVKSIAKE